jgi:hypothetical protein
LIHGFEGDTEENSHHSTTKIKATHHSTTKTKAIYHSTTKVSHHSTTRTKATHHSTKTTKAAHHSTTHHSTGRPKEGEPCSPNGLNTCSDTSIATCSNDHWVLFACPSTLSCVTGPSTYCGHQKRSLLSSSAAHFSYVDIDHTNSRFSALLQTPFKTVWFRLPPNIKLTRVENGSITSQINRVVKIHYQGNDSMVRLEGRIIQQGMLIVPNTFKFS